MCSLARGVGAVGVGSALLFFETTMFCVHTAPCNLFWCPPSRSPVGSLSATHTRIHTHTHTHTNTHALKFTLHSHRAISCARASTLPRIRTQKAHIFAHTRAHSRTQRQRHTHTRHALMHASHTRHAHALTHSERDTLTLACTLAHACTAHARIYTH